MVGEVPGERLLQHADLAAHPSRGPAGPAPSGHARRPTSAAIIVPPGDPEDVAGHHRQLDLGVLQQLLHPLLLRGARPRPDRPGSGSGPAASGSAAAARKLGRIICRSATLHSQTASSSVGLRSPGQVLDVLGVDQPGLEPVGLQQVERPASSSPLVASITTRVTPSCRAADRPAPATTGSSWNRSPPPAAGCPDRASCGHPHAAHQFGLADVQRRDPLDDLLVVLCLLQHPATPVRSTTASGCPQEPQGRCRI